MEANFELVFETITMEVQEEHELARVVNRGGCGWFCYFMMQQFEKLGLLDQVDLIYLDDWAFNDANEIEYNLANQCGKTSASHLMIRFEGLYLDAVHLDHEPDWDYWCEEKEFVVKTQPEHLLKACQDEAQWNRTYNPEVWNDKLSSIIEEAFNLLK